MPVTRWVLHTRHRLPCPLPAARTASPPCSHFRVIQHQQRRHVVSFDPTAGAQQQMALGEEEDGKDDKGKKGSGMGDIFKSVLGTAFGIALIGATGISYHFWYKWDQLRKMRIAFEGGYDPVLELAKATTHRTLQEVADDEEHGLVRRKEQDYIDQVIQGKVSGEYVLLLGPKGVGKSSMIVDAMIKNEADGVALCEAHEDPDVFRSRLGKCLNFEYNEDSFAGLFQMRDIKDGGALLDIERALNKLEKVAIRFRQERGRPIVLIFNNIHFIHDDDEGHALLHMIQQRAEAWAQSHVATCVFSADNFLHYPQLKRHASRMHVISVRDLTPHETHICLSGAHRLHHPSAPPVTPEQSLKIWNLIGGRLSTLGRISRQPDMQRAAEDLVQQEKQWLLHKYGLIPDHDDDVMDEQKVASCSFLLFQEFAKQGDKSAHLLEWKEDRPMTAADLTTLWSDDLDTRVTYGDARVIMTRTDYMVDLDVQNIIKIDAGHTIRPDSRLMLSVFRELCREPDFQERLDSVRDRIDEIESLHRTAELTVKRGGADLGGFLRLRVGGLRPEHEKKEEDDEEEDESGYDAKEDNNDESPRQDVPRTEQSNQFEAPQRSSDGNDAKSDSVREKSAILRSTV